MSANVMPVVTSRGFLQSRTMADLNGESPGQLNISLAAPSTVELSVACDYDMLSTGDARLLGLALSSPTDLGDCFAIVSLSPSALPKEVRITLPGGSHTIYWIGIRSGAAANCNLSHLCARVVR